MKDLKPIKLQKEETSGSSKTTKVKRSFKKLTPFLLIIGLLLALAILLASSSGGSSIVKTIFSGTSLKTTDDRVNVLLLGIPGGAHDGRSLTDTIMVVSYDLETNRAYLFSIPRDLWLPELKSKANSVYQIGLSQKNGLGLAKTVFGNVLGIPVHYALRVDFSGFTQAIDIIDGIEVEVERTFDDYLYPIAGKENDLCGNEEKEMEFSEEEAKRLNIEPGKRKVLITADGKVATDSAQEDEGIKYFPCRYEHISFEKGKMPMDGKTALSFVRSRHGTNEQNSDFARSARQQKVIEAIRNKVLSLETLGSPAKIKDLISLLGQSIDTDISVKATLEFYKLSKKLEGTYNHVLGTSLFIHPPAADYGGAYVLVSKDEDFSSVVDYVRKVLEGQLEYDSGEASAAARTGD